MEEFLFDGKSAKTLLALLNAKVPQLPQTSAEVSFFDVPSLLSASVEQSKRLQDRAGRHVRLKLKRAADWLAFLMDINRIIDPGNGGALRNSSVALVGPEEWMWWTAPPENIRLRTLDVLSVIFSYPPSVANLLAIFPALILLHPFKDGNCRSALISLCVYNEIYRVADHVLVLEVCKHLRSNGLQVARAASVMRIHAEVADYVKLVEAALVDMNVSSRGATKERMME